MIRMVLESASQKFLTFESDNKILGMVSMPTTYFSERFLAFSTFLIVFSREPVHGKDTLTVVNLYCPCVTGETDGRELFRLEFLQTLEERIKQLRVKR